MKEYEAQCFVGLSRLSSGTAKQLSEITDVPRTRVYDAIRLLEVQGLVDTYGYKYVKTSGGLISPSAASAAS